MEAGDHFPYFELPNGDSVYSLLKGPHFYLLSTQIKDDWDLPDFIKQKKIEHLPTDIFEASEKIFILVRPDNYISYIGTDPQELRSFLSSNLFKISDT